MNEKGTKNIALQNDSKLNLFDEEAIDISEK